MNRDINQSNLLPIDNIYEYIQTLQENYSKYYCLYTEACKQLKKCLETKQELGRKLSVVENLHQVNDRNQYVLQGKLNSCLNLKDNLEKMLLIKSQTKQQSSFQTLNRCSKMSQEHLEKLESLHLKQKLNQQNLWFERYEKFDFSGQTTFTSSLNTSPPLLSEESPVMDTSETSRPLYNNEKNLGVTSIALEREEEDRIALVASLRKELYQLGTTVRTKETAWCQKIQEKDEVISKLTRENKDLKQLVSDLRAGSNQNHEVIIKLSNENESLKTELTFSTNYVQQKSYQLSKAIEEISRLKTILNQQYITISKYEMENGKMISMLTDQSREMEETKKMKNHRSEINLDLKTQLENSNKTSQEKLLEIEGKLETVRKANQKCSSQVQSLQTKLDESENLCFQLKNENSIFQKENNHLKSNVSTVKALQLTIDDLKLNIEKSHADYIAFKNLTEKSKAAHLFQIENLKKEIENEKLERIKVSNQLEISNNSLALVSKTIRTDHHLKTHLDRFISEIRDSMNTVILTSSLVPEAHTTTTDTTDHDYSFSLNFIQDKVKNLVENYKLSVEQNSFLEENGLKLTANNKTLQDSNQVLAIKNRKIVKQLKQIMIAYNLLKEKETGKLPSRMNTLASKYKKQLSHQMAVTNKYKKLNLKLKLDLNGLNSQLQVLTMKNTKLYNYFDQVQNKIKHVHREEIKTFKLKNKLDQELENLRFIYENLHTKIQTTKLSNITDNLDETGLKFIRYYYQTVLKYIHREYVKTHPECVQSLLNEIRNLSIPEKNNMIYSSLGKVTFNNIHQYYTNILNKLEIEITNKTDEISHVITDSIDYKLNLDRLNLSSIRFEETEMTILKNIQENQRLDELEDLRIIEAKYHLLDYFLKFLFEDYRDILTLVKVLQKSVLVLEQNDIKGLMDFIISEGISFSSFKGYYQTIQNLISFFKQDIAFTFFPEDVNSLINILKDFGGHAFIQSLKDIILLKETYPEYESLFTVFNDLKHHYTSAKIFHFHSILQLVFEIHKLFPDENDIERLKLQFLDTCMIKKYGINEEQLMNLLTLEKISGDRVTSTFDEIEDQEELKEELVGESEGVFNEYEFDELEDE